jgi:NAD(P)H dehydrogenase (quinone)
MKFLKAKGLITPIQLTFFLSLYFIVFQTFAQSSKPIILIAYYSQSGNTKKMAESIAEGANSVSGIQVKMLSIDQVKSQDLLDASAILVGSPVYNANIAPAVQEFINSWPFEGRPLKDKIGAAFVTGGGISIGEEGVMLDILRAMLIHGMIVMGGEEVEAAFGASAITGEGPFGSEKLDELFLKKGFGLGKRVAQTLLYKI